MEHQAVKSMLESPLSREWTVQGLGMLRCYLTDDKSVRLHIWDRSLVVPGVSPTHTHPWDFLSDVIVGRVFNQRFLLDVGRCPVISWWNRSRLKCGTGAHLVDVAVERVLLAELDVEQWAAGQSYYQDKDEIHRSMPEDGTVTIVTRRVGPDPDHAWVYWRGAIGTPWGSAEPRAARDDEVMSVTRRSLETWF